MKYKDKYLFLGILFLISFYACSFSEDNSNSEKEMSKPRAENECPKGNHPDSIIPIIYGFPTEEDFRKSDSGLVALGGCELPEKPSKYWCKIHKVDF
jgi:hypothetical protein